MEYYQYGPEWAGEGSTGMIHRIIVRMGLLIALILTGCANGDLEKTGLVKVADDVYAWIAPGPGAGDGLGANSGFIIGTEAVMVIDTRYTPELAEELLEAIRSITDVPVKYVVNTHYHPDHTWGNSVFAGVGATIISTRETRDDIEKYTPIYLSYYRDQKPQAYRQLVNVKMTLPDSLVLGRTVVDLGGISAEIYYDGPGHTAGDVFVTVPRTRTVFAGGLVSNGYHPNMSDQGVDFDNWKAILGRLATTGIDRVVPGQGMVSSPDILRKQQSYIDLVIETGKNAIRKGIALSKAATGTILPGTEGYRQENMVPFNLQAVYKKYTFDVVAPSFKLDLPEGFEVKEGSGSARNGRILWTSRSETGYSEVEVTWQPTHRVEIILQDIHDRVTDFLVANQEYEMHIAGAEDLQVGKYMALSAYGRWGYALGSGKSGSGLWEWVMFLHDGKAWAIKVSTDAGGDRDQEIVNMNDTEAAIAGMKFTE
ncbi:MAG: MBL fold metallo-hydrolase [Candidatus Krumholzibacteria bacterium]|nr:MBL fold metallo-hydrolase [Candidatus Krumholzibacteria bacterium]